MGGRDQDELEGGLPFDGDEQLPFDLGDDDPATAVTEEAAGWAGEWDEEDITNVSALGAPRTTAEAALDTASIDPQPGTLNAYFMHLISGGEDLAHILAPDMVMVSIGRGRDNAIQVASDGEISRRHCLIMRQRDQFFIEDLGSTNGTMVDGQHITIARLEGGEEVQLGESVFRFVFIPQSSVATARTILAR